MRHEYLIAGVTVLAISAPALAEPPISLHSEVVPYIGTAPVAQTRIELAQLQAPAYPPPAPQAEMPPPASSPSYVWEPGRWSWDGLQYSWEPGKYVERPTVSATFVPGHWEQRPAGWVWVQDHWDYPSVGSSTPPVR